MPPLFGFEQDEPRQDEAGDIFQRIRQRAAEADGRLRTVDGASRGLAADKSARVLRQQLRTGIDPDLIEANLDELEKEPDQDFARFRRESPRLAKWLSESKHHMAVVRAELGKFANLENTYYRRDDPERPLSDEEVEAMAAVLADGAFKRREAEIQAAQRSVSASRDPFMSGQARNVVTSNLGHLKTREDWLREARKQIRDVEKRVHSQDPVGFGEAWDWFSVPFITSGREGLKLGELLADAEAVKDGTATDEQRMRLILYGRLHAALDRRGTSAFGIAAEGIGEIPAFMVEFFAGTPAYALGRAATIKGLKWAVGRALKSGAKKVAKEAAEEAVEKAAKVTLGQAAAGAIGGTAAATPVISATRLPAGAVRRMLETRDVTVTPDDEGALQAVVEGEGDGWGEATWKSAYENFVQNLSERTGLGLARAIGAVGNAAAERSVRAAAVARWMKANQKSGVAGLRAKLAEKAGWHGVIGEMFEERVAEGAMAPVDGYRPPSWDQLAGEAMAFMVPGGLAFVGDVIQARRRDRADRAVVERAHEMAQSPLIQNDTTRPVVERMLSSVFQGQTLKVPLADIETYAQGEVDEVGAPRDARAIVEQMTGSATAYDEAREAGTDVVVPFAKYVTSPIARNKETAAKFAKVVKPGALEVSPADEAEAEKELAAVERSGEQDMAFQRSMQAIRDDIGEQLRHVAKAPGSTLRLSDSDVETMSALVESFFATVARRTGMDPLALWRRYGIRVHREGVSDKRAQKAAPKAVPVPSGPIVAAPSQEAAGTTQAVPEVAEAVPPASEAQAGQEGPVAHPEAAKFKVDGGRVDVEGPKPPETFASDSDRGFSRFGERFAQSIDITLTRKANLSTFLHEMGHSYLFMLGDLAQQPDAPAQVRADFQALLDWFGVKDPAAWEAMSADAKRPHHEKFAKGFEAYLMRGKDGAPTKRLQGVFSRFAGWLARVYKAVFQQRGDPFGGVNLTPEVTHVMDRLLATEEEIAAAEAELGGASSIFDDPAKYGLTPEQAAKMQEAIDDAKAARRGTALGRIMDGIYKSRQKAFDKIRKEIREDVTAEVDEMPVYRAFYHLRDGTQPDGSALPLGAVPGLKLSEQEVEAMGVRDLLPRGLVSKDGISLGTAAEFYGFGTGELLVQALARMTPREALIDGIVEERLIERAEGAVQYAPAAIVDEAMDAMHDEDSAKVMREELKYLLSEHFREFMKLTRRIEGQVRPSVVDDIEAERIIDKKAPEQIDLGVYRHAESKAVADARKARDAGDWQGLADALRRRILNNALYRAAMASRETAKAIHELYVWSRQTENREKIGKGDPDANDQIDKLFERVNMKPKDAQARARKSLAQHVADLRARGMDPAVEERFLDETAPVRDWRSVPMSELKWLRIALESIIHSATRAGEVRRNNELLSREVAVREIVERLEKRAPVKDRSDAGLRTALDRIQQGLIRADTELAPVETIMEILDGGALGPMHDYIWNPMSEAQGIFGDLMRDVKARLDKVLAAYHKDNPDALTDKIATRLGTMSRLKLISIALNTGNAGLESNLDKMSRGEGWSEAEIMDAVAKLSRRDLEFVQGVWDEIEPFFPLLDAVHRKLSGVPLAKVKARPFTVQTAEGDVKMRGGYYPVVYDRARMGEERPDNEGALFLFDEGSVRPNVPSNMVQHRTNKAAPIYLNFQETLERHIVGAAKHIAYRERLMDVYGLLTEPRVKKAITERLGPEYYSMLIGSESSPGWLRAIANEHISSPSIGWIGGMAEWLRANTTVALLAFKATTVMSQFAGLSNSLEYITKEYGASFMRDAMMDFYKNAPANLAEKGGLREFIESRSAEMRHRADNLDRDIGDLMRRLSKQNVALAKRRLAEFGMSGIVLADRMVSLPTWLAGYRGALAKLKPQVDAGTMTAEAAEKAAIHAGDGAVRRSQGAGGAKDLSALLRRRGVARLFTMFFTPYAAMYGRQRSLVADLGKSGIAYAPAALARLALISWMPAVFADLLSGRVPDDDEEEGAAKKWGKWAAWRGITGASSTIPFLRDLAAAVESYTETGRVTSPRFSPVLGALGRVFETGADLVTGNWSDELGWDAFEASGYVFGIPTSQAAITGEYLNDLLTGEARPEGTRDFLGDLLYRRSRRERKGER